MVYMDAIWMYIASVFGAIYMYIDSVYGIYINVHWLLVWVLYIHIDW
jgi:hypothetical protein